MAHARLALADDIQPPAPRIMHRVGIILEDPFHGSESLFLMRNAKAEKGRIRWKFPQVEPTPEGFLLPDMVYPILEDNFFRLPQKMVKVHGFTPKYVVPLGQGAEIKEADELHITFACATLLEWYPPLQQSDIIHWYMAAEVPDVTQSYRKDDHTDAVQKFPIVKMRWSED